MGDSEMVATEATAAMDYASTGYASTVPQSGAYAAGTVAISTAAADGTYPASAGAPDGTAYADINSDAQGDHNSDNVTSVEYASTAPSHGAAYNASVNGTAGSEAGSITSVENGNAVDTVVGTAAEQPFLDGSVPTLSSEEERLWNIVRANSLEFDAWTALIEETEKVAGDKILKIRKVYDAFLAEFPLCYGYWKKYADHEARIGSMDKVVEVYERAVLGVTYSVDIWLHYCIFAINTYGDAETIRRLFERGLAYVGTDYLCFPLWDKYIEYEEMHGEWGRVAMIYTRILEIPNRRLDDYLNRFKAFVASRPLSEFRTADEAASTATVVPEDGQPIDSGEHHQDTAEQSSKPVSAGLTEAEELEKYIAIREEIYKKAKEFDSKIADFENSIRRPYFHVRPLNDAELENWHNYLDFIERQDDLNKVVKLYERCLIACANYPDYWIRYVLCMEVCGSMDLANNALARATQVFVKRQPEIHLFAARFREQNGDIPGARAAYHVVHTEIAPGLLEAIINHANMENRLGKLEDAFSLFEEAIAIEKGKEHSQTLPALYAQYTRFIYLVSKNADKAREILVEALENVQLSKPLLEAFIHLESFLPPPKRIDYLDSLVDKFIIPSPDAHNSTAFEKEELSSIFLEFLGIFGDAQSIKKAADRHTKLFLPHRIKAELKKRHAEDYLASDKAKAAKAYTDTTSPAQSAMGAYGSAQNQWAAGYGMQPQAWPQVSQAQWTSGYSQAAYGAYGSYGSSYATQAPASVPQTTPYGAYPPTYPSQQAFPQQNYTQPAAAAPMVPTQPAASVPQQYYGTTTYY